MGANSKIEWTHHTANTWWGCTKVSDGCKHCYAETFSKRTGHDVWGPNASRRMMKGIWSEVVKWAKDAAASGERRRVFWGSMMDVCEDRPELVEPRKRFCGLVEQLEDLDFLILTKRPENYLRLMEWGDGAWPNNAWAGTSVEHQSVMEKRVSHLLYVGSRVHWLSAEPLLGPLSFNPESLGRTRMRDGSPMPIVWNLAAVIPGGIDWVIVGGESGPGSRPFNIEWARAIVRQCKEVGVPVFVKQLGAHAYTDHTCTCGRNADGHWKGPSACFQCGGRLALKDRKGGDWDEWPEDLRVREFPAT